MDFLRFLITKTFLRHLGLAVGISIILFLLLLLWLKIYTRHNQAIAVPNLIGLTLEEVDQVISSRDLRFEVIDSIYSQDMPRGTVVKQEPEPDSKVKKNRRLFITMNAVNPEKIAMPQLVDLSLRQAQNALENAGLTLGDLSFRPDFAENSVLQQNYNGSVIESGTLIEKGSKIDLVLGMGLSSEKTTVPDLLGLDMTLAKASITSSYLNFGLATFDETVLTEEDSILAFVYRQDPEFDEEALVNKGMEVFIWLTIDSTLLPVADSMVLDTLSADAYETIF